MEELKDPYVSKEVIEFLEQRFNINTLMSQKTSNNDEHIGFMKGVREVINSLKNIHEDALEQEV